MLKLIHSGAILVAAMFLAQCAPAAAADLRFSYQATVLKVIDGDTIKVHVEGWPAPFDPIDVRIFGVDTPEHVMPPAQARCEVALGVRAMTYGRTLARAGDAVTVTWSGKREKYGRLLGSVTLADGRDWAGLMIAGGYGRPYGADGHLHKAPWCADAPGKP